MGIKMPEAPLERQDIIELLAKLKAETPDYPADLVEARKAAYLKQIVDIQISRKDQGGEAGKSGRAGGAGRPGAALGGGTLAQGISLKAAFAVGVVIAMLTAAYLFRDQIVDFLAENEIINVEETVTAPIFPAPADPATEVPTLRAPSSGTGATETAPGFAQSPATPTAPVRGSPFNVFEYLICILQHGTESCQ
jgi:hypothetical protein